MIPLELQCFRKKGNVGSFTAEKNTYFKLVIFPPAKHFKTAMKFNKIIISLWYESNTLKEILLNLNDKLKTACKTLFCLGFLIGLNTMTSLFKAIKVLLLDINTILQNNIMKPQTHISFKSPEIFYMLSSNSETCLTWLNEVFVI